MDEMQLIGYVVTSIITLGGFIGIIIKFVQPINDLRVVIQRLNDTIENIKTNEHSIEQRITKHGEEIDKIDVRVGKLETKVDMYHSPKH